MPFTHFSETGCYLARRPGAHRSKRTAHEGQPDQGRDEALSRPFEEVPTIPEVLMGSGHFMYHRTCWTEESEEVRPFPEGRTETSLCLTSITSSCLCLILPQRSPFSHQKSYSPNTSENNPSHGHMPQKDPDKAVSDSRPLQGSNTICPLGVVQVERPYSVENEAKSDPSESSHSYQAPGHRTSHRKWHSGGVYSPLVLLSVGAGLAVISCETTVRSTHNSFLNIPQRALYSARKQ